MPAADPARREIGRRCVFSIVYARLVRDRLREPLTDLSGELMGMIVLPYLGPAAARREQACTASPAPAAMGVARNDARGIAVEHDPLAGVPMRLTYRTARVLGAIAERPGVSNRIVAELAGVADQGQISKLLARLERLGLTFNAGDGHSKGGAQRLEPETALGRRWSRCVWRTNTRNQKEAA